MPETELIASVDDPKLLDAIDRNVGEANAILATSAGAEVHRGADFIRYVTDVPDTILNGIHAAHFSQDTLEPVDGALSPFKERSLPFLWQVNETTDVSGRLGQRLLALGLKPDQRPQGFAVNVNEISSAIAYPGLTIARVQGDAGIKDWVETFAVGMSMQPAGVGLAHYIVKTSITENDWRQVYYVAYFDGAPLATSMLFFSNGVAGIHSVSTLPEARNKGVASEVVRLAALDAGKMGYPVAAFCYASHQAAFTAQIGFKPVAQYTIYTWTPPE